MVRRLIFGVSLVLTLVMVAAFCHGPIASAEEADAEARPVLRIGLLRPALAKDLADAIGRWQMLTLSELSKYTDREYTTVPVTMDEARDRLASGDIDFLLPAPPSFVEDPAFAVTQPLALRDVLALYARPGDHRYLENDLRTLAGARIGVPDGRPDLAEPLASFCAKNSLDVRTVTFAASAEVHAALARGDVDLLLDTTTGATADESFVLAFGSAPVTLLGRADRLDLVHGFDNAIAALTQENALFAPQLTEKFLKRTRHLTLHFTPAERACIESLPTLTVALYGDEADFHEDLLALLAKDTGFTLNFVRVDTRDDAVSMLENGEADIVPDLYTGASDTSTYYYTNPIESDAYILIGKEGQALAENGTIAVPSKDDRFAAAVKEQFPNREILPCKNEQHALAAVASGRSALAIGSVSSLEASRNLLLYPKLAPMQDTARFSIDTSLAIRGDHDRMLQTVLNKAIQRIDPQERQSLLLKQQLQHPQQFSFVYLFAFYPIQTLIALVALYFIGFSWNKERLRRRRKEKEDAARENYHYQSAIDTYKHKADTDALTGACNKEATQRIVEKFLAEAPASGRCHAFFICDLDHFKDANDLCGHAFGDEILCSFAKGLRGLVRNCDLVGRFGGDEFVLFLPNAGRQRLDELAATINVLAHRIDEKERASNPDVAAHPERPMLSVSIGIAVVTGTANYDHVFRQADHALYDVKKHGRNGYHVEEEAS